MLMENTGCGRRYLALIVAVLVLCMVSTACSKRAEDSGFTLVDVSSNDGALLLQLQQHVIQAKALGQRPFVQITALWCGPCRRLRDSMDDALMQEAFHGTYILRLDIDEWRTQFNQIGLAPEHVPAFYALDAQAQARGEGITGAAWGEDVPQNMAPPLKAFFRQTS